MGLSTLHIGRISGEHIAVPAVVEVYQDGNLAKVRREHVEKSCFVCGKRFQTKARREENELVCTACTVVTKECKECGHRWRDRRWPKNEDGKPALVGCPKCGAVYNGNKRSTISRFSVHSRRRLMRMLATVRRGELPCFVTLTFPDSWDGHTDPKEWQKVRRRFEKRFVYHFPGACYFWRLEVVDRKSGERLGQLSPHFHLLVFGVSLAQLREFVPVAFWEAVGTGDEKHLRVLQHSKTCEQVKSRRGIFGYVSKTVGAVMSPEMGKSVQAMGEGYHSRWWGLVGRENFAAIVSAVKALDLTEKEAMTLLRAFRHLYKIIGRDLPSLTVFIDGDFLCPFLARMKISNDSRGFYHATRRPYDVAFSAFYGGVK